MGLSKLKIGKSVSSRLSTQLDCENTDSISVKGFFELHGMFIKDKVLERLAPRTISEYEINMD